MGTSPSADPLREQKIRASVLLKHLRSTSTLRAKRAAARMRRLPPLSALSLGEVVAAGERLQRKHALEVVALEAGYPSWTELKRAREAGVAPSLDPAALFTGSSHPFLNRWFASYEEARASLEREGGYLFPFGEQFVVCGADLLRHLGADPADPDWEAIGHDWVSPGDPAARARLERTLVALGYGA